MSETRDSLKVGDRVWRFDVNRRVYPKDEQGRSFGGPIHREHFCEYVIVGEEKRSWLIARNEHSPYRDKVGKQRIDNNGVWFTDAARNRRIWIDEHAYKLFQHVRRFTGNVEVLRRMAEMVGYTEGAKE